MKVVFGTKLPSFLLRIALICAAFLTMDRAFQPVLAQAQSTETVRSIERKLKIGDGYRAYRVYVPSSLKNRKQAAAVILNFHGGQGSALGTEKTYGMDDLSDKYGFIAVYPEGLNKRWHDGRPNANPGIDDIPYISAILDDLKSVHAIDKTRIFACGISNGAMFCNHLALCMSDKIRAIVSIAGAITKADAERKTTHPVSVLLIHGKNDRFVPFNGGNMSNTPTNGEVLSHEESVNRWLELNGGPLKKLKELEIPSQQGSELGRRHIKQETPAQLRSWQAKNGAIVESVVISNGGHTWPGKVNQALFGIDGVTAINVS
ncbi:MAG: hypothetical protein K2X81_24935, partial [Candidatus Obscuribacterales bacterium]|nr:hypothetical protein [Candidatus Obscuribacterales bacterium]